jgi:DNA-directed RNA polymerase specialized sigma24 family protein
MTGAAWDIGRRRRVRLRVDVMVDCRAGRGVGDDADPDDVQYLIARVADWPTPMRQVFTLRKVYGLRPRTIARTLGLSEHEVERCLIAAALACGAHRSVEEAPLPCSGSAAAQPLPSASPAPDSSDSQGPHGNTLEK